MTGAWQPWAVQHLKEALDMGSAAMVASALRRCGHLDLAEHQGAARPCSWGWGLGSKMLDKWVIFAGDLREIR